jgi:hypothetical protein
MNDLLNLATTELARFLGKTLPTIKDDWWQKHVLDKLSFQQQRILSERNQNSLDQLDFAALVRVLDQNWYEISNAVQLPREARSVVKELQSVRNKWAHLSSEEMPPSEVYRDADTLGRLLGMIGATQLSLDAVGAAREATIRARADPSLSARNRINKASASSASLPMSVSKMIPGLWGISVVSPPNSVLAAPIERLATPRTMGSMTSRLIESVPTN